MPENIPLIVMTIGNPRVSKRIEETGIATIRELTVITAQQLLEEAATTRAKALIFHSAQISGEPKRKFLLRLRAANDAITLVMLTPSGENDTRMDKTYAEARIVPIKETARDLPRQILKEIGGTDEMLQSIMEKPVKDEEADTPQKPEPPKPSAPAKKPRKEPQIRMPKLPAKTATKPKPEVYTPPAQALRTTIVIPIFTTNRGAGSTWLTIQTARYLTSKGCSCAVIGNATLQQMSSRAGAPQFREGDVEYYVDASVSSIFANGYDYILLDVGQVLECKPDGTAVPIAPQAYIQEIARASIKFMIIESAPWQKELEELYNNKIWMPVITNAKAFCSARNAAAAKAALHALSNTESVIVMPQCETNAPISDLARCLNAALNV